MGMMIAPTCLVIGQLLTTASLSWYVAGQAVAWTASKYRHPV